MKKILLVEDNIELAKNYTILLTDKSFDVRYAALSVDGLKSAIDFKPDIILCDIMLPDMSGYKLYSELKKIYKKEFPIFIFITAKNQRQDLRKGMELGADDYLTKPFSFEELFKTINVQIEKRNAIKSTLKNDGFTKAIDSITDEPVKKEYFFYDDKKNPGMYSMKSIIYIKSMKDYTQLIMTGNKKLVMRKSLKYWENKLPPEKFVRVHKQTIVNLDFVEKIERISSNRYELKLNSVSAGIEVSQRFGKNLKR